MIRVAQILSVLGGLFVAAISVLYLVSPTTAASFNGFSLTDTFSTTNMRTLFAPMAMVALTAVLGGIRKDWKFLLPAALYFLFVGVARIIGLIADGFDVSTVRGLVLAVVFFAIFEVALQLFRRESKKAAA